MVITHKIKIDLSSTASPARIEVAQDDKYSRNVEISLYAAGVAWNVPESAVALLRYEKADGKSGSYNTMPDGSESFSVAGNKITAKLAPQVCTTAGAVKASVSIIVGTSEVNTFPFVINVHRTPGINAVSEDYIKVEGLLSASGWKPNALLGTDADGKVVALDAALTPYRINTGKDHDFSYAAGEEENISVLNLTELLGATAAQIIAAFDMGRPVVVSVADSANEFADVSVVLTQKSVYGTITSLSGMAPNPLTEHYGTVMRFTLVLTLNEDGGYDVKLQIMDHAASGTGGGGGIPADLPISVDENGYTQIEGLPGATETLFIKDGTAVTVTTTLEDGTVVNGTLELDAATGYPASYTENGLVHSFTFTGFEEETATTEEGTE